MKVILLQDIRGKGKKGQMIEASDGYARNFLLPRKMAIEATADNVNTMKMNDKAAQERQAKERAEALEIRNRMNRGSSQDLQRSVEAESNLQDVANLIGSLHRNKEPLLHCAVYIEMIAGDM